MKIVKIKKKLIKKYSRDSEMLRKTTRPCVVIIKLKYKNSKYDFAIPFRSNIPASSPKDEYFPLPPRNTTRAKNRHGLHYIKLFPVKKEHLLRYRTEGNNAAQSYKRIIEANKKQIVSECQAYLKKYETTGKPKYGTDIDMLIKLL